MAQGNQEAEDQRDNLIAKMTPQILVTARLRNAKAGDKEDQYNVAVAYAAGQGVQQDLGEAPKWLPAAALQDHPEAQLKLALASSDGRGVHQDFVDATR